MNRQVIEADFRMPEYRDAKPEDYEFRDDGKLVRKDRWEVAIRSIVTSLFDAGLMPDLPNGKKGDFEIEFVVEAVKKLVEGDVATLVISQCEATPTAAQSVLDGTRSNWRWMRFSNGDLVLATYPRGDTYFLNEKEYP